MSRHLRFHNEIPDAFPGPLSAGSAFAITGANAGRQAGRAPGGSTISFLSRLDEINSPFILGSLGSLVDSMVTQLSFNNRITRSELTGEAKLQRSELHSNNRRLFLFRNGRNREFILPSLLSRLGRSSVGAKPATSFDPDPFRRTKFQMARSSASRGLCKFAPPWCKFAPRMNLA